MEENTQEKEIQYSKLSFEEMKELAEQGVEEAQNNLARCYQKGLGVEKDLVKALEWANKAAENGDEKAKVTVQDILQEMNELSPRYFDD